MNRKGPSTSPPKARPRKAEQPDPFRFGWRYVHRPGLDGTEEYVRVPLPLDDVLHPQERDHIPNNRQQDRDSHYLVSVLERRLADNPRALVLSDCQIDWGIPGLGNHSPDVSVFDGVRDPDQRNWGTFVVAAEGATPILAVEVVSSDAHDQQARENNTVHKLHKPSGRKLFRPCRRAIMAKKKADKDCKRLQALIEEATVDCYGEEEQNMGMMTMVEENVVCPFPAKVIGEDVEVTALESHRQGFGVNAVCRYKGKEYRIDITSLEWPKVKPEGYEWIEAYQAWLGMIG